MIVSIPTSSGAINICLPPGILKIVACIAGVIMLLAGYTLVNFVQFIMSANIDTFIRVVLIAVFVCGLCMTRFLLQYSKAGK